MVDFHRLLFKTYTFLATAKVSLIERDAVNYALNNGQLCYDDIGCFRNDDHNPCPYLNLLPYGPEQMDTIFYLYTPENSNGTVAQLIDYFHPSSMKELILNTERSLFVVVHGFSQVFWYTNGKFIRPMKDALIDAGNNVIVIDWVAGADFPNYYQAASNLRVVGAMIGNVISRMEKYGKATVNKTTVLGWSLGGQTAGFAGKRLVELGTPVGSIVGLDPSRSLFSGAPPACRLDSHDAQFVQIIHTNGGESDITFNSSPDPIGHVDFYANGGRVQDACTEAPSESKCSHDLSFIYYIESMKASRDEHACEFISFPCENEENWQNGQCFDCHSNPAGCPVIGYRTDSSVRGKFYFDTLPENETLGGYCGAQYLLTISSRDPEVSGRISIMFHHHQIDTYQSITFQSIDESLDPGVPKIRVIVLFYPLTNLSSGSILYDMGNGNGTAVWTVDRLELTAPGGQAIPILEGRIIHDGEPVTLDLKNL